MVLLVLLRNISSQYILAAGFLYSQVRKLGGESSSYNMLTKSFGVTRLLLILRQKA